MLTPFPRSPGLNEYEKEYAAYLADPNAPKNAAQASNNTDPLAARSATHLPEYLSESLRRGLDVFFAPDGPLELNLPRATRDKILVEAGNSGDPKDFAEARDIIEHSLNRSLAQHSKFAVANAGPRRLVFCFCLGLSIFLLGCVPPLVGILYVSLPLSPFLRSMALTLSVFSQRQPRSRYSCHWSSLHHVRCRRYGHGSPTHLRCHLAPR